MSYLLRLKEMRKELPSSSAETDKSAQPPFVSSVSEVEEHFPEKELLPQWCHICCPHLEILPGDQPGCVQVYDDFEEWLRLSGLRECPNKGNAI